MALAFVGLGHAAQSHTLVNRAVVADNAGAADDNAAAVIDENPPPQLRARVDFDRRQKPRDMRQNPRQQFPIPFPQAVVHAVQPNRVQPRIAQHNLDVALRNRIALAIHIEFFAPISPKSHSTIIS